MLTIENLREYGAAVDEGLERCLNDENFYLTLVPGALEESGYQKIEDAIKAGDLEMAFEACHALKGVLGNLALIPIYKPVSELTELLRAQTDTDYSSYLAKMWEERNRLAALM